MELQQEFEHLGLDTSELDRLQGIVDDLASVVFNDLKKGIVDRRLDKNPFAGSAQGEDHDAQTCYNAGAEG